MADIEENAALSRIQHGLLRASTALSRVMDALRGAAGFRTSRSDLQHAQLDRMAEVLPLPQIRLPDLFTSSLGRDELDRLAEEFLRQVAELPDSTA